jgi:5-methylcytosine-specific restriction endonuclease McrA
VTEARRSKWCSQRCVDAYNLTQPNGQLAALEARDHGVCTSCGLDTERLRHACQRWLRVYGVDRMATPRDPRHIKHGLSLYPRRTGAALDLAQRLTLRGLPTSERAIRHLMGERRCWWDGDHTVPIVDGGHPCDLANLRTLCWWCHKRETAEAATRRAEARRMERPHEPDPEPVPQLALFDAG